VHAGIPRRISLEKQRKEVGLEQSPPQGRSQPSRRRTGSLDPEPKGRRRFPKPRVVGTAVFGRTLSRREYPETIRVGDCPGSSGPAASLIRAGQNPYRLASPKCEDVREKRPDRRGVHDARNRGLKVSCVSAPSLRSISCRLRSTIIIRWVCKTRTKALFA